jgi:hypothetical protein
MEDPNRTTTGGTEIRVVPAPTPAAPQEKKEPSVRALKAEVSRLTAQLQASKKHCEELNIGLGAALTAQEDLKAYYSAVLTNLTEGLRYLNNSVMIAKIKGEK